MRRIQITAGPVRATAVLDETETADAIWEALPIEGRANTWGEEIYFGIPVQAPEEPGASDVVAEGDLAYWPPGSAMCVFFGPTPASRGDEVRAASAVNVFGKLEMDPKAFREVDYGATVRVEKLEE